MSDQPDDTRDQLLSELDSLQSLLHDDNSSDSIPVLKKVLDDKSSRVIPTLDQVILPEAEELSQPAENIELEILIQEVVDEFIPVLEIELRKRLQSISPQTLKQWLEELSKR